MIANDLLVKGDARIDGQLYCNFDGYLGKASGKVISINDAISHKLMSLELYGKSEVTDNVMITITGKFGINIIHSDDYTSEYNSGETITLYGIPVTTGGNYIDDSGQMWLCDTLECRSDDSVVITRRCKFLHLNGSEDWSPTAVYGGINYRHDLELSDTALHINSTTSPPMIVSRMSVLPSSVLWNSWNGISISSGDDGGKYLIIYDKDNSTSTSLNDFKLSLSSNPIDVVYALAEPYIEKIASMYGVLSSLQTSTGSITFTNTLNADMYLTYMKSNTLYAAIEGSTIGVLIRNHLLGNDGDISGGNGSEYKGSGIDVVDRLRIGGI